jgi:transglutaminase-like putative cysteine protease
VLRKSLFAFLATLLFLPLASAQPPAIAASERVDFSMHFDISAPPETKKITFTILVPPDIENRQKLVRKKYSIQPEREFQENGSTYARIVIHNPPRSLKMNIDCEVVLYRYDLETALAHKGKVTAETKQALAPFLAEEKYLEVNDTAIQKAAKTIAGKNGEPGVRQVMDFVAQTLQKGPFDPADHGAVWALKNKHGDCTEYSDLFVALCRAKGIPARACEGYLITEVVKGDTPKHDRAEVYLHDLGWVPIDPFHTFLKLVAIDRLPPVYIQLSYQRVNKNLDGYHFWSYRTDAGDIKVQDSFAVTRRKAEAGK